MRKFGLIGYPLSHSFSKKYFEEKFLREKIADGSYDLFPLQPISELPALLESHPDLCGLNVTIPHKESVVDYLNEVDDVAIEIGAVNCIRIQQGTLKGYNTDSIGFEVSLKKFLSGLPQQAFVLGTGGSSKAICYVLKKMGLSFHKVSRTSAEGSIPYEAVGREMKSSNLFINCTPLGMFPQTENASVLPYDQMTERDYLFDLVYNPAETLFLKKGKEKGAKTKNGLEMLELQAEESWKIWNS